MHKFIYVVYLMALVGIAAWAQTCVITAPPAAPVPLNLVVSFPNGSATGCTGQAIVSGAAKTPSTFPLSAAKCNQAWAIALQAAAIDNGWADGGTP